MAGITDFIFGGQPVPPQPTGSDSSTSFPLWLQQYVSGISNAATNLAGAPYTPYPGQQVATPSGATQASWNTATGNVGNYQPDLSGAEGLTTGAAQPLTGDDISKYMNPYMGNVIGGLTSAANHNFTDTQLPAIQDRFVSSGQSRSPQEAHQTNEALYQNNQALDQAIGGALGTGYQGALNTAVQQQQNQLGAGAQLGTLGALNQQLGAGDVSQLAGAGQTQDIFNQSNINAALNNFYAQQQWPYQNLSFASNIIRGLPVNSNQQVVGTSYPGGGYGASPLQGYIQGAVGSKALGLAKGGRVGALNRISAEPMKMAA